MRRKTEDIGNEDLFTACEGKTDMKTDEYATYEEKKAKVAQHSMSIGFPSLTRTNHSGNVDPLI